MLENQGKSASRSIRMSEKASVMLDTISDVCNNYNLKINGDSGVNPSILLTYFFEDMVSGDNKEGKLFDIFARVYNIKDSRGNELDPYILRGMIRQMLK